MLMMSVHGCGHGACVDVFQCVCASSCVLSAAVCSLDTVRAPPKRAAKAQANAAAGGAGGADPVPGGAGVAYPMPGGEGGADPAAPALPAPAAAAANDNMNASQHTALQEAIQAIQNHPAMAGIQEANPISRDEADGFIGKRGYKDVFAQEKLHMHLKNAGQSELAGNLFGRVVSWHLWQASLWIRQLCRYWLTGASKSQHHSHNP